MAELGVAASIIAVVGLAWSSSQALYDLIDGLSNAPKTVVEIKENLSALQKVLDSLKTLLKDGDSSELATIFDRVGIKSAIKACSAVCDDFTGTLSKYTIHSPTDHLSKRDRLTIRFFKAKIEAFKSRVDVSKGTIEFAVNSATLATSALNYKSSEEVKAALQKLDEARKSQTEQFEAIVKAMKDLAIDDDVDDVDDPDYDPTSITRQERDLALSIVPTLRQVCEKATSVAREKFAEHEFGKFVLKDFAKAVQVDMGVGSDVNMKFGDFEASGRGRGVQGAVTENAFKDFWNQPDDKDTEDPASKKGKGEQTGEGK